MRPLVWFRSDLRLADNPALHDAAQRATRGVLAVFLVCREQWRRHDMSPARLDFMERGLRMLSDDLSKRRIALQILDVDTFDAAPKTLLDLALENECDVLHFNREYEVNERHRDHEVERAFGGVGIAVRRYTDQCLFEPGEIRTAVDGFYTVFTPFRKAWAKRLHESGGPGEPLAVPKKQTAMVGSSAAVPTLTDEAPNLALTRLWPAGEIEARAALDAFIADKQRLYGSGRDAPAADGTSKLSPYLACGMISLRTCVHATMRGVPHLDDIACGSAEWIDELVWREFYRQIMVGFPRVCMHRPFKLDTLAIEWNDDDAHDAAWREGRTGFPIVDAAMRQLRETAWMHNRLRMITASFFTKNLFLDWRRGEKFFMQNLIDGDLGSNNGGWQWSASTGNDAAPYFRVFNPSRQSDAHDPKGEFIRRYVPELAEVEAPHIHDPPPIVRAACGYPSPIVDAKKTRNAAIEAFKRLRER